MVYYVRVPLNWNEANDHVWLRITGYPGKYCSKFIIGLDSDWGHFCLSIHAYSLLLVLFVIRTQTCVFSAISACVFIHLMAGFVLKQLSFPCIKFHFTNLELILLQAEKDACKKRFTLLWPAYHVGTILACSTGGGGSYQTTRWMKDHLTCCIVTILNSLNVQSSGVSSET